MRALILGSKEYPALFKLEGCGGIEVHVQAVVKNLQRKNVELFLITRRGVGQKATEHQSSLHVYRVPYVPVRLFRTFTFNMFSFFVALYLVSKYEIHLVHANDFTSGFFGVLVKRLLNRPLLVSAPAFGSRQPEWPSIVKVILRFLEEISLENADGIFLFTPDDIRYVHTRYGLVNGKIDLLGNGVDVERFEAAKPVPLSEINCQIQPESKIITFVGRLTKSKGLGVLIQACVQLVKRENVLLLIVGDGPERSFITNLVLQKGLRNRVVLLGTRRDVERLLRISDIFVLPSLYEGFPVALLEAMAARKPVIATKVGGVPMIVKDGVNGLLVTPGDSQELSDRLFRLLGDKSLRAELSENAYRTVREHYSWPVIAEKILNEYLFLVEHTFLVGTARSS